MSTPTLSTTLSPTLSPTVGRNSIKETLLGLSFTLYYMGANVVLLIIIVILSLRASQKRNKKELIKSQKNLHLINLRSQLSNDNEYENEQVGPSPIALKVFNSSPPDETMINTNETVYKNENDIKQNISSKSKLSKCFDGFMEFLIFFYSDVVNRTYIYTSFLVHVWDNGSDLGVMYTWYKTREYKYLSYISMGVVINYRIFSAFSFYYAQRSIREIIFQFLDIQLFVDVYRSSVQSLPSKQLYWIRVMEAVLESSPQVLLQFVYLYDEKDIFVLFSLFGSMGSVVFSFLRHDDKMFLHTIGVTSFLVYGSRFFFRLFEVLGRTMILALIWNTWDSGIWVVVSLILVEFLFYGALTQFRIPPWELVAFVVTDIDLTLTFEGREGALTKPLRKNILYRLIYKPVIMMFTKFSEDDEIDTFKRLSRVNNPNNSHSSHHRIISNDKDSNRKKLLIAPAHYVWRFLESIFLIFSVCTIAFFDNEVANKVFGSKLWVLLTALISIIMTPILYCFVRAFADDNVTLERNLIALIFEHDKKAEDEVRRLINSGANLTQTDYRGNTVAHACCRTHSVKLLKLIALRSPYLLAKPNNIGFTPSMEAAASGAVECLDLLHQFVDLKNEYHLESNGGLGETLVHIAAKKNQASIIQWLAQHSKVGNLRALHKGNVNACHVACVHNSTQALSVLIKNGVNVHALVDNGDNCAIIAAQRGHVNCLRKLRKAKVNLNHRGDFGHTPFFRAAIYGHPSTMKWLANNKCNMYIPDDRNTAVEIACFQAKGIFYKYLRHIIVGIICYYNIK